jgi:RNA polymerase sigma-70 factor (ECF subfamily)
MAVQPELRERFRGLVALYAGAIRRLAAVYVSNAADRDDFVQEILLAVWRALPGFRGDASERTWLYRIAHNVALTYRRKSRHANEIEKITGIRAGTVSVRLTRIRQNLAGAFQRPEVTP